VLVSHDRHLLRTVADEFLIVHAGRAQPFDGDLEDYAKWLDRNVHTAAPAEAQSDAASVAAVSVSRDAPPDSRGRAPREAESADARKQRKREEAARRNKLSPLRAAVAKWEQQLQRLADQRADVAKQLEAPDIYSDAARDRLRELLQRQTKLARETEQAEASWLASSEQLETLTKEMEAG
jgi:ATP-binding cassette subfamily F protein 3